MAFFFGIFVKFLFTLGFQVSPNLGCKKLKKFNNQVVRTKRGIRLLLHLWKLEPGGSHKRVRSAQHWFFLSHIKMKIKSQFGENFIKNTNWYICSLNIQLYIALEFDLRHNHFIFRGLDKFFRSQVEFQCTLQEFDLKLPYVYEMKANHVSYKKFFRIT